METPFLKLGPKQWLSGLSSSAHTETGGVLYKADGITPLYDAGGTASAENGMLQAGASPTDFTGNVVVDNIFAGIDAIQTAFSTDPCLFMMGNSGHLYRKASGSSIPVDLRVSGPIANARGGGLTVWSPANGTKYLFYWNGTQIGTWNLSGAYPTGWTDNAYTGTSVSQGFTCVHQFNGNVYYTGSSAIGALLDDGAGGVTHSPTILDFQATTYAFGLTDDGTYLVTAVTQNISGSNTFSPNKILFWDTHSSQWTREYEIRDPYIWNLKNIGGTVYAFGQYGIYEITFSGGVRKVLSRLIGFGTAGDVNSGYGGKATVYNDSALMFATDTTIDTFGKLQPDVVSAYYKHFKVPAGVGTPTFLSAGLDAGRVYVATDGAKLYAYDFNNATHDTGNTAQTVYFALPSKTAVRRIDLIFGEPLASGDAISVGVYTDQDTAVTNFGSATYTANGAIRRKSLFTSATCEEQMSLLLTFTSGAVKLKRVEVFGDSETA